MGAHSPITAGSNRDASPSVARDTARQPIGLTPCDSRPTYKFESFTAAPRPVCKRQRSRANTAAPPGRWLAPTELPSRSTQRTRASAPGSDGGSSAGWLGSSAASPQRLDYDCELRSHLTRDGLRITVSVFSYVLPRSNELQPHIRAPHRLSSSHHANFRCILCARFSDH